jgi:integrase/recombinase XerC
VKNSVRAYLDAALADGDVTITELAAYLDGAHAQVPTVAESLTTLKRHTALAPTSRKLYGRHWDLLVDRFGDRPVTEVRAVEIADLGTELLAQAARGSRGPAGRLNDGRRAHTAFHNAARALWADAYRRLNLLPATSPAHANAIPRPKPNPARRGLFDNELLAIFDTVRSRSVDPALHVLILRALLESGARRTGLMHATLGDLSRARSTITVTTKGALRQELLLAPATVEAILDLAEQRGSTAADHPCFRNRSGSPANDNTFDGLFRKLRTHLPDMHKIGLSAHHFRHTFGSRLERAGSEAIAAAALGHVKPGATAQYVKATQLEVVQVWSRVFQTWHPLLAAPETLPGQAAADPAPFA